MPPTGAFPKQQHHYRWSFASGTPSVVHPERGRSLKQGLPQSIPASSLWPLPTLRGGELCFPARNWPFAAARARVFLDPCSQNDSSLCSIPVFCLWRRRSVQKPALKSLPLDSYLGCFEDFSSVLKYCFWTTVFSYHFYCCSMQGKERGLTFLFHKAADINISPHHHHQHKTARCAQLPEYTFFFLPDKRFICCRLCSLGIMHDKERSCLRHIHMWLFL